MLVGGSLLLAAVLLAALLIVLPLRIRLSGQARIDPALSWAAAGAIAVGPLVVSAAGAREVRLRWNVHVLGRRLLSRTLAARPARPPEEPRRTLAERWDALIAGWQRAKVEHQRWTAVVDPLELGYFLFDETARVRVDELSLTASYGADDPTVTGTITGYAYVLDTLLGPRVHVDPRPDFTGPAPIALDLSGSLRVFPALAAFDTLRFIVRRVRVSALRRALFPRRARELP